MKAKIVGQLAVICLLLICMFGMFRLGVIGRDYYDEVAMPGPRSQANPETLALKPAPAPSPKAPTEVIIDRSLALSAGQPDSIATDLPPQIPEVPVNAPDENSPMETSTTTVPLPPEDTPSPAEEMTEMETKYIALTFDDGPESTFTPRLLDILAENNAKATFFVLGHRLERNADVLRRIAAEGHCIGNHSYNHKNLTVISTEAFHEQVDITNRLIKEITGYDAQLLRPPYGDRNQSVVDLLKEKNMSIIIWDIDPKDWQSKDSGAVYEHVVARAHDGDIILLHDIYESSVAAAEKIIVDLTAKGYVFVTVPELIGRYGEMEPGGVYRNGKGTVQ